MRAACFFVWALALTVGSVKGAPGCLPKPWPTECSLVCELLTGLSEALMDGISVLIFETMR